MTPQDKIDQLRRDADGYDRLASSTRSGGYALMYERWAKRLRTQADEIERTLATRHAGPASQKRQSS